MKNLILIILTTCLAFPALLIAEVYKKTDEKGNVIYSDVPDKAGERPIKPPPIMTIKPLAPKSESRKIREGSGSKPSSESAKPETSSESSRTSYSEVQITNPSNDQAVRANGGSFDIQIASQPGLNVNEQHRYVVLVDGQKHQEGTSPSITLMNMARGTHSLSAQVQDKDGNVLASSDAVTIHVLRASAR